MNVLGRKSGCRAVAHDLWDYVGERLPENALERVEQHLTVCAACQVEVAGMRRAQALLTDCRRHVPAPRSDWHDLQDRMRAEGMISPLSGRILVQHSGQEQSERPARPLLALDWNRLSLAGSVTATLVLSITIYRLMLPPTLNFTPNNEDTVPALSRNHSAAPRETSHEPDSHFAIGDFHPLLIQASSSTEPEPTRRTKIASPHSADREPQSTDETESASPIDWENKGELPHSSVLLPKKYVPRTMPSQTGKPDSARPNDTTPPLLPQEGRDAKTRYIMRGLTPASFIEEEGIY